MYTLAHPITTHLYIDLITNCFSRHSSTGSIYLGPANSDSKGPVNKGYIALGTLMGKINDVRDLFSLMAK